jgi:glycosyltransferase involved in cell wall biosynthesis
MQPDVRSSPAKLIAFILPDLRAGGVERMTIALIEEFLHRGYRVDLVLGVKQGELLELVPDEVRVFSLDEKRLRRMIAPLRRYLKLERPDALCAAIWALTSVAILAKIGLGPGTRVVVSEHNPLTRQYGARRLMRLKLSLAIFATHRFADGIVAVSDEVGNEVAKLAGIPRTKITTIYNPVRPPPLSPQGQKSAWSGAEGKRILSVGHLKAQKNHLLLIKAFARLLAERDATLAIVGEGDLRPALEELVGRLGLGDRVLLPGFSATPGDWYEGADLFVLSSDFEGFGNVLVEALHCGLPIVSTDCPGGPHEILAGGKWGRLISPNDPDMLAQAMVSALDEPVNASDQRNRAADFSIGRAADGYETLLFEHNGSAGPGWI